MSKMEWTGSQQNAISARGGPLLVSAAAGSGKTAVLVQRVMDIITDPESLTDIDRFLVVTYTNAAAEEMKQRIGKRLNELLADDPANGRLLRQQLLLGKAQISTIHSFCRTLAKEYFHALDIPSDFRIADDEELSVIRTNAMDTVLERRYKIGGEEFLKLVDYFASGNDDGEFKTALFRLYDFLRSQPFPKRWAKDCLDMFDSADDPDKTVWGEQIRSYAERQLDNIRNINDRCIKMLDYSVEAAEAYMPTCEKDGEIIELIADLIEHGTWDEVSGYLKVSLISRGPFFPKLGKLSGEDVFKKAFQNEREKYKNEVKKLAKLFYKDSDALNDELQKLRAAAECLFELADEYEQEYEALKAERSVADYSDLEHYALRLLVRGTPDGFEVTDTARQIADRFDYVMVDEYQDANLIQDIIFDAVSSGGSHLFVVGDVKQSIYRFRQAMPEIFMGRREQSVLYDKENEVYPAKINLDANFRSRSGVTDAVNFVFGTLMSKRAGEIDYNEDESLKPEAKYPESDAACASFHLVEAGETTSEERLAAEARYIAQLIYRYIAEEKVTENGEMRTPTFGDIAVLIRSTKKVAPIYIRELQRMGIPVISEKGDSFFSQPEVRLMISLLRVIDNPARDIPLAAVLVSPIFGFSVTDLAKMRAENRKCSLYEALLLMSENDERAKGVCETLDKLRLYGCNVTSDELIRRIYDLTFLPEIVLSGDDGEFRRRNLRLLTEYAKKYEASGFHGVSGFVAFLDRLRENGGDFGSADRRSGAQRNAVRVMTIHKSKGLQFPICIVAGLGREFNKRDLSGSILFDSKLGIGMNMEGGGGAYRYKGTVRAAVENAKLTSMISEELRVLYVAMTRACEKLVLVASVSDAKKTVKSVDSKLITRHDIVRPCSVMSAEGFFELLLYCMLMSRSGDILRSEYDIDREVSSKDKSRWEIVLGSSAAEENTADDEAAETSDEAVEVSSEPRDEEAISRCLADIKKKLSRTYAGTKDSAVPVKVSASALAERETGLTYAAVSRPAFMDEGGMSAAERGTALHLFAQHCDFLRARKSIPDEKERLVSAGFLTRREADSLNIRKISSFLSSGLLGEILSADRVEREYRFMVEIPAGLADPMLDEPQKNEPIVLQGAMDCIYEKDGVVTVVDYKTDYVNTPDELVKRYSAQLALYKHAAAQIFQKQVRCVIYSFGLGETIVLPL